MNVPTIEMDPTSARVKAIEFSGVKAKDPELAAAKAAYHRLAKGDRLIDLRAALRAGGVDEEGMPCLAVARADRRFVTYRGPTSSAWSRDRTRTEFDASSVAGVRLSRGDTDLILAFEGVFPEPERKLGTLTITRGRRRNGWPRSWSRDCHGVATVPMVPPSVEKRRSYLKERFILWEVEEWAEPKNYTPPMPPGDPYLLEHLEGDLYAIVGEWDLTPLEQAIVQGRDVEVEG